MAAASQTIGKVFIVYGTVKAVTPSGLERVLAPNSPIHAGDRIVTGPDGMVAITFTGGGQLDLGRMSDVLVDEDVYAGAGPDGPGDTVAQVDEIQSALEDGDSDPTIDLPPPAVLRFAAPQSGAAVTVGDGEAALYLSGPLDPRLELVCSSDLSTPVEMWQPVAEADFAPPDPETGAVRVTVATHAPRLFFAVRLRP